MGDKGGRKDKAKNKQQQVTKRTDAEHKKLDKARPGTLQHAEGADGPRTSR